MKDIADTISCDILSDKDDPDKDYPPKVSAKVHLQCLILTCKDDL